MSDSIILSQKRMNRAYVRDYKVFIISNQMIGDTFTLERASWMPPPPMLYLGVIGKIEHKKNWGEKLLKWFMNKVKELIQ